MEASSNDQQRVPLATELDLCLEKVFREQTSQERSLLPHVLQEGPVTEDARRAQLGQLLEVLLTSFQVCRRYRMNFKTWELAVSIIDTVLCRAETSLEFFPLLSFTCLLSAFKVDPFDGD